MSSAGSVSSLGATAGLSKPSACDFTRRMIRLVGISMCSAASSCSSTAVGHGNFLTYTKFDDAEGSVVLLGVIKITDRR